MTDLQHCPGVSDESGWREGCENCLRRSATGEAMDPPGLIVFWCEFLVE